jgi:predicted phosphodiesterase
VWAVRLAVLSDLHGAARLPEVVRAVACAVETAGANWLVCAGDVGGGGAEDALRCLRALDAACAGRVLFVPGNHDVWCRAGDSWAEWRRLLAFPGNLERGNRELGEGWVAVGTGGWYDYSLAVPGPWTERDVAQKHWGTVVWRDGEFARWGAPDPEVALAFGRLLEQRLAEARRTAGARLVAVTHVVPFADALGTVPEEPARAFCRAFLGSARYGEALRRAGCAWAVFGHSHVRRRGSAGGVRYVCAPLGYPHEWVASDRPVEEVAAALAVVDLDRRPDQPDSRAPGPART